MTYLTVSDVAVMFGLSRETVRQWCRSGLLVAHQDPVTGWWYIEADSVMTLKVKYERAGFLFNGEGKINKG
jgi:predicted site-specific integrase-resolvase